MNVRLIVRLLGAILLLEALTTRAGVESAQGGSAGEPW